MALLTKKLPVFLSRLNEINGGCENILPETGCSRLFVTLHDCSRLFEAIRRSLFEFSRHGVEKKKHFPYEEGKFVENVRAIMNEWYSKGGLPGQARKLLHLLNIWLRKFYFYREKVRKYIVLSL